jgi:allophanate hydrolase
MNITALHRAYAESRLTPTTLIEQILERIVTEGLKPVWITVIPKADILARAAALEKEDPTKLPLYGVPFAVKDNIDVAGIPTTAACPAFAYVPTVSATVVQKLEAAGAILIGKTNMDQFATGLVGTRSPFGVCSSVFSKDYISGGSSSGSSVAVAKGLVSFSLGTDTAGSGRVPAMFNNLIGLKPTRGIISTAGVVPACRTLDCVSIFAETAKDAATVLAIASGPDPRDTYSRVPYPGDGASPWAGSATFRFGVPPAASLEFFGDPHNPALFQSAVQALTRLGGIPVEFDLKPFLAAASLLYNGPWIAERYAAVGAFAETHSADMDPVVAAIVEGAKKYTAAEAFEGQYTMQSLHAETAAIWRTFDVMLLPTSPRTYTLKEIADQPIERNSHLGTYTNFVNLMDLAAVALPAGMRPASASEPALPFGVSLIGRTFSEPALLPLADRLHRALGTTIGGSRQPLTDSAKLDPAPVPNGCLLLAVVGAHLTGQPLNWQLTDRGGRLIRTCKTHPDYKLYALANTIPPKPGLVRVPGSSGSSQGPGIEVEVWALPADSVGSFIDGIPQPLGIGKLMLEDGTQVMGFIVEPEAINTAQEITQLGGWRNYLATLRKN